MKVIYAPHFKRNFKSLSKDTKKKFKKQIKFLLRDIHHPSLKAKKYEEGAREEKRITIFKR